MLESFKDCIVATDTHTLQQHPSKALGSWPMAVHMACELALNSTKRGNTVVKMLAAV